EPPEIVRRPDGSWLVNGRAPVEQVIARLGLPPIPHAERGHYLTLAGLVLARLGRIPHTGETVEIGDFTVEIVDMDGRRIDMVLIHRRVPPLTQGEGDGGSG
ncbi:MAG TPA: transporter associated domain-containing protein, partial [Ktedonobacterales bacterium]